MDNATGDAWAGPILSEYAKLGQPSYGGGAVARSSSSSHRIACSRDGPHISADGCRPAQNAGRSGWPKMAQPLASVSWMQRTPAGLPLGIPGIGDVIEGAVQHAPHPARQLTLFALADIGKIGKRVRQYTSASRLCLPNLSRSEHIRSVEQGFEHPAALGAHAWAGMPDFRMHRAGVHGSLGHRLRVIVQTGLCHRGWNGSEGLHAGLRAPLAR